MERVYDETARDRKFFRCTRVLSHTGTGSLDPRDCQNIPLKTAFRYAQVPFNV